MAVINQINLVNNVGEQETYDIETKITPAVRAYIENQNLLSDFETITLSNSSATPTEMEYDGFLLITRRAVVIGGSASSTVNINGIAFTLDYSTTGNYIGSSLDTQPVKKGDVVFVSGALSTIARARFFKNRDYTNRQ